MAWYRPRPDAPEPEVHRVRDDDGRQWRLVAADDEDAAREMGVEVHDQRDGIVYRLTLDRTGPKPVVTSLQVDVSERERGRRVEQKLLERVPLDFLRRVAADYLADYDKARAQGRDVYPITMPEGDPDVRAHGDVPPLAELARLYNEVGRARMIDRYVERYGVSRATVDRWIRQARDEGHIAPSTRPGRPPKTSKIKTTAKGGK